MKITLSTDQLNAIDTTSKHSECIPAEYRQYYHLSAGQEHYRLLIHLTSYYNNELLVDMGTNHGASALALANNPTNTVYSVDIVDLKSGEPSLPNCKFELGDVLQNQSIFENMMKSRFIMLDTYHEYDFEIAFYTKLVENSWKGIMICDDIHLNPPMHRFWSEITHTKLDISKYGHGSGTGVVIMDDTEFELL
jgi:hypothetical protein